MPPSSSDIAEGCIILAPIGDNCPPEVTSGVSRVLIANKADIEGFEVNADGSIKNLTYSQINRKFFEFYCYVDSIGLNATPTFNAGANTYTLQTLTMRPATKFTQADLNQLDALVRTTGYVYAIVQAFGVVNETLTGNNPEQALFFFGYLAGGHLTASDGFLGAAKGDPAGALLTFTSQTTSYPKVITPDPAVYTGVNPNASFLTANVTA